MVSDQPLISVVMSNYNGEKYLAAAIESILVQSYKNFEAIFVDDGSSDGSVACFKRYAQSHPNIQFIPLDENCGQANGFNVGIEKAKGSLISFMDSDDLWHPEKLQRVAQLYLENPEAVLFQHNLNVRFGDEPTKTVFRRKLLAGDLLELMVRFDRIPYFTPTTGLTFTRDVLDKVGPIPVEFRTCADGYLTRTSMCFGPVCASNEAWGEYRIHGANATIDNPAYSDQEYLGELLFPKLRDFYTRQRIDFDVMAHWQRRRGQDKQIHVRTKQLTRIYLASLGRSCLNTLAKIPLVSNVVPLLPGRLKKQLNIKRIAQLHGRHELRRAFILGMGPSLAVEDLDKLKDEITFACNKIYLCFDETDWRPTYYSVIDILVAENNRYEINRLDLTKIYTEGIKEVFSKDKGAIWVSELAPLLDKEGQRYFRVSEDLQYGVYGGFTVIFFQIQLALYMGIREIYLLGLDFSFDLGTRTGETSKSGEVLVSDGEVNHFHKDYRKKGETWTVPQLDMQKMAFQAAQDYADANGIRIFNASRITKLEVFERVDLDEVLGNI